MKMPFDELS
jgi:voltage-dependent calcium channel L type alpha-1D